MKCILLGTLLCSLAGCSSTDPGSAGLETVGQSQQELNGSLSPSGFLVGGGLGFYNTFSKNLASQDEAQRVADTDNYYDTVGASATGDGDSLRSELGNLGAFRTHYHFNSGETITRYYNRGDLGIGREMHCRKDLGQIACYVTNYSAGRPNVDGVLNEFTFGFSPQIAFSNMEAGTPFATVAMVYRPEATTNKIVFIVYDASEVIQSNAALDRHAINFVDKGVGTPGVNLNNHVPTNCLNCHGGAYTSGASPNVEASAFLPFDLDQFDYKPSSGFSRDEASFRDLNQKVREVAVGLQNESLKSQIDAWYGNSGGATLPANNFNGNGIVSGWQGAADVYQKVVRPSCRGCHMTSAVRFDSAADFLSLAPTIGADIKGHVMPHALQTQRLFWQSGQPAVLANYFKNNGQSAAGDDIAAGSPTNIVTLDPHLIPPTF
jgi:hypothetical protein